MIRRRSKQIIAALLLAALATSCSPEQDEIPGGSNEGGLRFEVQMANNWSSTSVGASSRAAIEGTAFPGSEAGTVYNISLSILKADGTEYVTGAGNILAELTVKTNSPAVWRYKLKDTWLNELPREGLSQPLTISAYYPYYPSALIQNSKTYTTFYLATAAEQANQTDVLYTTPKALNPDGVNVLDFKHFYALFEFQLKKPAALNGTNDVITLNSVSFANAYGKGWVANQGWYDVRTGIVDESSLLIGPIHRTGLNLTLKPATNSDLADPAYQAVQVLVPPRAPGVMDSYADGNIQVHFDFGTQGMATFDINRYSLFNSDSGSKGITGGMKYTYKLIYDTRPDGAITLGLTGWADNSAEENMGETPTILDFNSSSTKKTGTIQEKSLTFSAASSKSYNGYTYATGNAAANGGYRPYISNIAYFIHDEPPYQKLEIAKTNETITQSQITWENAWDFCKKKTTNGGGWRLPRLSEWILIYFNESTLTSTSGFVPFSNGQSFWSGTEYDENGGWRAYYNTSFGFYSGWRTAYTTGLASGSIMAYTVRCVREIP